MSFLIQNGSGDQASSAMRSNGGAIVFSITADSFGGGWVTLEIKAPYTGAPWVPLRYASDLSPAPIVEFPENDTPVVTLPPGWQVRTVVQGTTGATNVNVFASGGDPA